MKRYPAYKDSNIEWVGEIPDRWSIKPLFALFKERQVPNEGNAETNVLSLSYGRIIRRDVESNFGLLPESFETYNIVEPLDIVLRLTDLQNDKRSLRCGLVQEKGIITSAYLTLERRTEIDPKYMYYLLHNYDIWKVFYSMGGGVRQAIKFDDLKRLPMLLPSFDEQKSIASYLDHKIAQINDLINKKERMIGFLIEERMAIINQAVTKGIDSKAEMKESGIEWLGAVPTHWQIKKLKHLLMPDGYKAGPFGSSLITSELLESGEIKVLSPEHIADDSYDIEFDLYLPGNREIEMKQFFVKEDDIIFPIVGTLGRSKIITREVGKAIINQRLARITVNKNKILPEYASLLLSKVYFYQQLDCIESKGSILDHITKGKILNRTVLLPSLKEQKEILQFLSSSEGKISLLVKNVQCVIDSLKEYRTSLISEVVTGKICVCN